MWFISAVKNNIAIEHFHRYRKVYWTVLIDSNGQKKILLACCLLLSTHYVSGHELSILCSLYYFCQYPDKVGVSISILQKRKMRHKGFKDSKKLDVVQVFTIN